MTTATTKPALGDALAAARFYGLKTFKARQLAERGLLPGAFCLGGIIRFDEIVAREESARLARTCRFRATFARSRPTNL